MKLIVIVLALLISACSSHPTRVDCEGHLRPINTPDRMESDAGAGARGARR